MKVKKWRKRGICKVDKERMARLERMGGFRKLKEDGKQSRYVLRGHP